MNSESNPPKVFISYSHNYDRPDYKDRILALADRLRTDGIDCNIDQYEESPPEGWHRWMLNQVDWADFILIACTEEYNLHFRGKETEGKGKGAIWEGAIIIQGLYDIQAKNSKFIPITLNPEDSQFIPSPLRSATYYKLDVEDGYESLYRRLTGQAKIRKPKLGKLQKLAPRDRKQDFKMAQSAREIKRSQEIQKHITLINNYRNHNAEEIGKSLKRLRIIAKGDPKTIQSVSNLISPFQKSLTITLDAVVTLEKIAKDDEKSIAVQKVLSIWKDSNEKIIKKIIIKCLGEIGNGNKPAIKKLISILRSEKDSVLIQSVASSLAKIGVGNWDVTQAMETKIRSAPLKPKILRDNLVKNLKIIDPGNSVAAQYTR
jgi:SEFIR domain